MPAGPTFAPALRRLPFTFALAGTILITTAATGTLTRAMTPDQLEMWGFGGGDLSVLRWLKLPASIFQILEPNMVISMLATVLALVGSCEYRLGTRRTVTVFACSQLAGLLAVVGVSRLLAAAGNSWGLVVAAQQEAGASPGSIGALGAWLAWSPRRLRAALIALCALFLAAAFAGNVHPWDVAHAAAFPCGLLLGAVTRPRAMQASFAVARTDRRLAMAWIALIVGWSLVLAPFVLTDMLPLAGVRRISAETGAFVARWLFLIGGVMLCTVAPALRRGERRAWLLAWSGAAIAFVGLWQPGAPGVDHVLSILLVAGLFRWRDDFGERSPGGKRSRAAILIIAAGLSFAVFGFVALRWQFAPPFGWGGSVDAMWSRLRFQPVRQPNWDAESARWFLQAVPITTYVSVAWAVLEWVRSGFSRKVHPGESSAGRTVESV